jgi:hypothetical protein
LIIAGCIQLKPSPCGDDEHIGGVSKIVVVAYNVKIFERGIADRDHRGRGRMFVGFTTMQSVSFNTDVVRSNLDQSEVCNIM